MEQSINLVDLPMDVLEIVAGYLTIQDLLVCCVTSRQMREIFNDDCIWRARCDKRLCEYLKDTPCKVEPHFITPKFDCSTLSQVPEWKSAFMRQNHLWNNWRQGRETREPIWRKENAEARITLACADALYHFFLNSDCIIAVYLDRIEFYDVKQTPLAKAANDIKFPKNLTSPNTKIIACNHLVFVLYKNLALVYQVDLSSKESALKHAFFIEDTITNQDVNGEGNLISCIRKAKGTTNSEVTATYTGNFFLLYQGGETRIHIWNLESGLKIKEQDCPIKNGGFTSACNTKGSMNVILTVEESKRPINSTFVVYNIAMLKFLPFQLTFEGRPEYDLLGKHIAIWVKGKLNVYDYETSQALLENQPIQSRCAGFRNNFVFLENNTLKMFSPSSKLVRTLLIHLKVYGFAVLNHKFIQIDNNHGLFTWEIDETFKFKRTIQKLGFHTCSFFLNETSSRYILRSGWGIVIHFW